MPLQSIANSTISPPTYPSLTTTRFEPPTSPIQLFSKTQKAQATRKSPYENPKILPRTQDAQILREGRVPEGTRRRTLFSIYTILSFVIRHRGNHIQEQSPRVHAASKESIHRSLALYLSPTRGLPPPRLAEEVDKRMSFSEDSTRSYGETGE